MKICSKLTDQLVSQKIITSENREIYEYGLECFILKGIHLISYFLVALSTDKILELFLFFLAYYPIRIYAGGFHANTRVGCYIFSCCQVFIVLNAISIMSTFCFNQKVGMIPLLIPTALLIVIIMGFTPVDSVSKRLDYEEKMCYQRRVSCLVCFEMLITIISLCFHIYVIYMAITIGFLTEVLMLLLGRYKNRKYEIE